MIIKTLLKILFGLIITIIVLLGAGTLLLNTKYVQNKLLVIATNLLSEKLETRVKADSISVNLFSQDIALYGLDIDDQQQRKMLQVGKLTATLGLESLTDGNVIVKEIETDDVEAIIRKEANTPANYQFLIEAFRKKPEEDTITTEKKKLNLDIEQVRLRDIHLTYNKGDTLTDVSFNQLFVEKDGKEHLVSIDSLRLKTDYHRPRKNTGKPHRGFFDVGHFDVTANMKWTIHLMEKDSLNATLTEANFKDPTMGINLTDVRFDMAANRKAISLSDITIQQTNTKLNIGHGNIILPDKETGRKFSYSTGKIKGHVVLKDISRTFAPCLKNFHLPLQLQTTMSGTDNTIHFRNIHVSTKDKKLQISAYGNITNLKVKKQYKIQFQVKKMHAKGDIKEKIINQFIVKKLMMKQLRLLGDINYTGSFTVIRKHEAFQGRLGTAAGSMNFKFAIDDNEKYVSGEANSSAFHLGKVMDMKDIGNLSCSAAFKIDISKKRTGAIRRAKGGKLPIGTVSATVNDCSYKKIHIKNLSANIESDGAIANGDILKQGKLLDLFTKFSFTDTDQMQKIKIIKPGLRFHKKDDKKKKKKE